MAEDPLQQIQAPRSVKFTILIVLLIISGAFLPYIVLLGVTAYAATKASYRWFDTFLWFVPFVGWYWGIKILWRWCSLPDRYWDAPALPAGGRYGPQALAPPAWDQPQLAPQQPRGPRFKI